MHPLFEAPRRLVLYLGFWLILGLFRAAVLVEQPGYSWPMALALAVPLLLFYAFVCAASWYVCRVQPLRGGHITESLGVQALAALVAAGLWVGVSAAWSHLLTGSVQPAEVRAGLFLSGVMLYLLVAAGHYIVMAVEQSRAAERDAMRQAVLARDAELRALRAQLNPHFLFNSLHSISALTAVDPSGAREMCLRLGDFLRYGLQYGAMEEITLARELEMVEQYLGIEQIRFGPRLTIRRSWDAGAMDGLMPPLLLQPLVENAIKHGIATLVEGGTLVIGAGRDGDRLQIVVENPFDAETPSAEGSGVGLANVRERVRRRYGREAALRIDREAGRFRVTLELPWRSE